MVSHETSVANMHELSDAAKLRRAAYFRTSLSGLLRPVPPEDLREEWEWELEEAAALDGLVPGVDRLREHAFRQAGRVY